MADTYESKMQRREEQGSAIKIGNKYYAQPQKITKQQTQAAAKLGMTEQNLPSINVSSVLAKARELNSTQMSYVLRWLDNVSATAALIANKSIPVAAGVTMAQALAVRTPNGLATVLIKRQLDKKKKEVAQALRTDAQATVRKIANIRKGLEPINRNLQMEKQAALRQAYAQSKGYTSDDAYAEYVATTGSEFEWYAKTYGTEDPIRIEALKTLERRDNQGKTGFELALEGKEISADNIDAIIEEIDETALTEQVALALQEEQKQAELARQAAEKRNQILLYTAGGVGVAAVIYFFFLRK